MPEDDKPLLSPPTSGGPTRSLTTTHSTGGGKYSLAPSRISFPSSSTSALYSGEGEDPDLYDLRTSGYRPTPTRNRSATELAGSASGSARRGGNVDVESGRERRQGVPKLSRECLWSEFKCYGTYIFPPLAIFGVLAIGISLSIFGWKKGWFDK